MRPFIYTSILFVLAAGLAWQCKSIFPAADVAVPLRDSIKGVVKNLKDPGFNKNELIVFFKGPSSPENSQAIKDAMSAHGIDVSALRVRSCNACTPDIQLWQAPDIYTFIHAEGVRSGSGGGGSNGVGENSIARFSLNFTSRAPTDSLPNVRNLSANYSYTVYPQNDLTGKDTVLIAVLDTGVDTARYIHSSYLWRNNNERPGGKDDDNNCYSDDIAGWNFLSNDANFHDDNNKLHGTLVTKYIIDQFRGSTTNGVQIMPLRTHDANGYGNLFAAICALHYAIDKNVQIINASWGFYNYGDNPVPYLDSIITQVLPLKGILFITAAGNKIEANDAYARNRYRAMHGGATISDAGLRNLVIHNFYLAMLSNAGNNVITVTTTDGIRVSPTQNHSALHVDLGVKAHNVTSTSMQFAMPFKTSARTDYISGSSFATAIAAGRIGANFKRTLYVPGITKTNVFNELGGVEISPVLNTNGLIRGGRYIIP